MPKEQVLVNDIITDHRERMLNLKKYYPFFKLSEVSFSWFMEGACDRLDMGYILMAVLRFFIEENNFKERDVTYPMYYDFMSGCIRRDFGLELEERDNKILVDYIFDKLKNDGRPFSFEYYDPVDRVKKVSRVKLLESRIQDGTVWYSISPDGIEFYLDTKEIRDESRISVEQLLLEKMIRSNDFKGGAEVIRRINQEVERLKHRKNQVMELLAADVFAGMDAYTEFFDTGMKWFDDEQKLFVKNKELIETALKRAENDRASGDTAQFYRTLDEIYRLDTELKTAMHNHSELLRACTELGIQADEIIRKTKLSRLRGRFDFKGALDSLIRNDRPDALEYAVKPFFRLNIHKKFTPDKIDDMFSLRPQPQEKTETAQQEREEEIVFEDELAEERFAANVRTLLLILFDMLTKKGKISLREYNQRIEEIFGAEVFANGDYYAFLVHLCGKKEYSPGTAEADGETFLDGIIRGFMGEESFARYAGLRFTLELGGGEDNEIDLGNGRTVTDFAIKKV